MNGVYLSRGPMTFGEVRKEQARGIKKRGREPISCVPGWENSHLEFIAPTGSKRVLVLQQVVNLRPRSRARLNFKLYLPVVSPTVSVRTVAGRRRIQCGVYDGPQVDNPTQQNDPQQNGHDKHETRQYPATL